MMYITYLGAAMMYTALPVSRTDVSHDVYNLSWGGHDVYSLTCL